MRERQKAQGNVQSFLGEVAPDKVAGQIATVMSIEAKLFFCSVLMKRKNWGFNKTKLSAKLSKNNCKVFEELGQS